VDVEVLDIEEGRGEGWCGRCRGRGHEGMVSEGWRRSVARQC
jgi:hypothetical protein